MITTDDLQQAYNRGRKLGRLEGVLSYINHVRKQTKSEYEKLEKDYVKLKSEGYEDKIQQSERTDH